jgi:hypothetical protein
VWLREIGVKKYDLGGIDPELNPGVFYFKRGFSGTDICQIAPLTASDSPISSTLVGLGSLARRLLRSSSMPLNRMRPAKQPVS